ncbi:hypothetical protein CLV49_1897 [Labedella gwakjiensis]|uniref:Uncharacterized protein n=1 Tax=Labedella gwakjiensis TaxID=390269 RepID=A0A2P8GWD7_9MICO|nr:hypothetical protein [Labedella gwakjiensis]PSL38280.1 hypothetical protein CLV49_1897 [Labedella gwakjiensis]RUQ87182.1 hypothetical protein ELQ93_09735 [Labedella gwakjiensis]
MIRVRRRLLLALGALAVLLMVGGSALVVVDANARMAAAAQAVTDVADFYEEEQGYDVGPRAPMLRTLLADSLANDGPMPAAFTQGGDDYVNVSYGAFGGIFSIIPLQRPWAPRMLVIPIAAGGVLLMTVLLIGAAGWTPRRRSVPGTE